ncbi:MAG TPA: preprotein translocase subunit SecE [Alphaproteobacteria bacterium]|nr:preprotein translocase subunit SecE [Alphaproteobacteria bacterium]
MARTSPAQFFREVRQEVRHVTWPSRKETVTTTSMVFLMVVAVSLFLSFIDWIIGHALQLVLGIGAP